MVARMVESSPFKVMLPFHQMGRFKWKELGLDYKLQDTEPPSTDLVERAVHVFRSKGLKAY